MKKIASFLLVLLVFNSCSENVKFNDVAFQALKNTAFWKAPQYTVTVAKNGSLTIEGINANELLTLETTSANKGNYVIGNGAVIQATYNIIENGVENNFATGISEDKGFVKITKYDGATISGEFEFKAINEDLGADQLYVDFKKGYFNNLPVTKL